MPASNFNAPASVSTTNRNGCANTSVGLASVRVMLPLKDDVTPQGKPPSASVSRRPNTNSALPVRLTGTNGLTTTSSLRPMVGVQPPQSRQSPPLAVTIHHPTFHLPR
ncbi:MAG: hypothetical protein NTW21_28835 [Verrucomicrobia bacterium]|nr:hypothetical protein [Verrucomicrobiota bacterium]